MANSEWAGDHRHMPYSVPVVMIIVARNPKRRLFEALLEMTRGQLVRLRPTSQALKIVIYIRVRCRIVFTSPPDHFRESGTEFCPGFIEGLGRRADGADRRGRLVKRPCPTDWTFPGSPLPWRVVIPIIQLAAARRARRAPRRRWLQYRLPVRPSQRSAPIPLGFQT